MLIQGSIMTFKTVAISQRMTVNGFTYEHSWLAVSADPATLPQPHNFDGQGRRLELLHSAWGRFPNLRAGFQPALSTARAGA